MKYLQDLVPGCSKVGLLELNSLGSAWLMWTSNGIGTIILRQWLKFGFDNLHMDFDIELGAF